MSELLNAYNILYEEYIEIKIQLNNYLETKSRKITEENEDFVKDDFELKNSKIESLHSVEEAVDFLIHDILSKDQINDFKNQNILGIKEREYHFGINGFLRNLFFYANETNLQFKESLGHYNLIGFTSKGEMQEGVITDALVRKLGGYETIPENLKKIEVIEDLIQQPFYDFLSKKKINKTEFEKLNSEQRSNITKDFNWEYDRFLNLEKNLLSYNFEEEAIKNYIELEKQIALIDEGKAYYDLEFNQNLILAKISSKKEIEIATELHKRYIDKLMKLETIEEEMEAIRTNRLKTIKNGMLGKAIGDALGVPVEFRSREYLERFPVIDMMGYMCWNQPPGTWSDDTTLALCLMESLSNGYDLEDIANNFLKWYQEGYWGAHHKLFDIGNTTREAIVRIKNSESAKYSGNFSEESNGNGSLMRTLPLAFFLEKEEDTAKVYEKVQEVSSITHAHFRSNFSCFIYVIFIQQLIHLKDKFSALNSMQKIVNKFALKMEFNPNEIALFDRVLKGKITDIKKKDLRASGYVLHALEASFWCFLTANSFQEAVLTAVNLGEDTDTTGAITGGLAGVHFGLETLPQNWLKTLARKEDIDNLCEKFHRNV